MAMKGLFAAAGFTAASMATAAAQEALPFFKDKQIRIIVGSAAGAGYDINARTLARYYGKHIPGYPTFIVQNQVGAASITMANMIYNTSPRDGTVIGAPINGMPTAVLFTPDVTLFVARRIGLSKRLPSSSLIFA